MGKGYFEITPELFESALLLPEGMKILKVNQHVKFDFDLYSVMVEHPDIPDREEGELLPRVVLTYQKLYDKVAGEDVSILSVWTTKDDRCASPITLEDLNKMFERIDEKPE